MKVLIINPQTTWKGENGFQNLSHRNFNDHLGIRYVAAAILKAGHEVDVIDAHFEEITFEEMLKRIKRSRYDVYGISFVESIVEQTFEVIDVIKKSNPIAKIFVGGYGATLIGNKVLLNNDKIDLAVVGEGEVTSVEIINNIYNKEKWHDISGIMYMENGHLVKTKYRPLIEDLDSVEWPMRANIYKYGRANMVASRGCYGSCTYCSISEFYSRFDGHKVRIRNPVKVVDEMEYMHNKYNVHYFDFVDDNFTCTCRKQPDWIQIFVSELKKRKLNVTWGIQARANDIDEELFLLMKKGGLRVVSMGIENDVERVMGLLKTGTSKKIHRHAVETLRKLKINMYIEMILLEPSTKLEEIRENLNFLTEINFPEVYRQNPITFSTKLHLYTGTSVVRDMEKYCNMKYSEYHVSYEFSDPKVELLNRILVAWQEKTATLATLQLCYIQYDAKNKGLLGVAMNVIKLSKQYLKMDLEFYKAAVDLICEQDNLSREDIDILFSSFEKEIDYLTKEFMHAKNVVYSEKEII